MNRVPIISIAMIRHSIESSEWLSISKKSRSVVSRTVAYSMQVAKRGSFGASPVSFFCQKWHASSPQPSEWSTYALKNDFHQDTKKACPEISSDHSNWRVLMEWGVLWEEVTGSLVSCSIAEVLHLWLLQFKHEQTSKIT